MPHPQKIETVHVETLDGELCIYDWQRMKVHNLNPTAAKVWELCDGQTSPQQIAEKLQAELNTPHAEELVWLTLVRLEKAHLLQEAVVKPAGHKVISRRDMLKGLGLAAAMLPVVTSIVAPGPVEAQSPQPPSGGSQTFTFTGAEQQFTVPAGVTSVTIEAFGAQGGDGVPGFHRGGEGGMMQGTITVTPGEALYVYVGGEGGNKTFVPPGPGAGGVGGFNGGGAGGAASTTGGGNGGGGASDVRQGGNALSNRVIVAGGGGGNCAAGTGGDGGYPDGLPAGGDQAGDGKGGTQTAGGAGGAGIDGGNPGTAGTLGIGGTGGSDAFVGIGGGGGGGGYYGGGGGGADADPSNSNGEGGGGGGSGFVIPTATNVSSQDGGRTRDGQVIISW